MKQSGGHEEKGKTPSRDWKLHLPDSSFPMRANAAKREPELRDACTEKLYEGTKGRPQRFVLHDGPPYANGPSHLGHALNKVLKDTINRFEASCGKEVVYIPGWDCHGLPIELKAVQSFPPNTVLTPELVTRVASQTAQRELQGQMTEFRSWAVMGDWNGRYETMDPNYEAAQLKGFRSMVERRRIHQGVKPVWWSPVTKTALAEAELEYQEKHVSLSAHVAFPFSHLTAPALQPFLGQLNAVAWTTTPWTLPANRALAVHPEVSYVVVRPLSALVGERCFLVAETLVPRFEATLSQGELSVLAKVLGADLVGSRALHPLVSQLEVPVLGGDYVTTEAGTGVVHTAPGHGQDDYLVCLRAGIEPFSPVDDNGKFDGNVGVASLVGLPVLGEGNRAVLALLKASGLLLAQAEFVHKYPYDWRSKTPVVMRATRQWFLDSRDLRDAAVAALDNVRFFPPQGRATMQRVVSARQEDWCISRQRYWGVPIPAFYHRETGDALMNVETVNALLARMDATKQGVSTWWTSSVEELLPASHAHEAHLWEKGTDTMDVWMDSGLSWAHMVERGVNAPFDMVLEGTDQYRGWFQSSLLTWLAAGNEGAPWKSVVVHGFALDSHGVKMSKSVGNVIPPSALTHGSKPLAGEPLGFEANGVDVMRLWVTSHDFSKEVTVSRLAVDAVVNHYKKLRNTIRWILGNLSGFDPASVSGSSRTHGYLAHHLLHMVEETRVAVLADFGDLNFSSVLKRMTYFVSVFSGLHVESMKDELYCGVADDPLRRSYQYALFESLKLFVLALQPTLAHTMVDVLRCSPPGLGLSDKLFLQWNELLGLDEFVNPPPGWHALSKLRDETNRQLEFARNDKLIGSPLDAQLTLVVPNKEGTTMAALGALRDRELAQFFGTVSQVRVLHAHDATSKSPHSSVVQVDEKESVSLSVSVVSGACKCPRCKRRGSFETAPETMCPRCVSAMKEN